ncbi:hypothetical protein SBD_7643 [Streptomyces bottropensis ATCC 25435]|uniref:Uncharacterized protein n=1 Tax=Streptomyces bottropensis ATCC 25435 TaxID=1054862 RepID=M3E4T3_9ACTN|nr:hypothetical protein SBD_7643 [Streptomyces bottropensis ATCC 25435]
MVPERSSSDDAAIGTGCGQGRREGGRVVVDSLGVSGSAVQRFSGSAVQ